MFSRIISVITFHSIPGIPKSWSYIGRIDDERSAHISESDNLRHSFEKYLALALGIPNLVRENHKADLDLHEFIVTKRLRLFISQRMTKVFCLCERRKASKNVDEKPHVYYLRKLRTFLIQMKLDFNVNFVGNKVSVPTL